MRGHGRFQKTCTEEKLLPVFDGTRSRGRACSEFETLRRKCGNCPPFTKESLLYREIFEQYYPGQARMIRDFWMPNRSWEGCDVDDPSARVLSNYGESGK